MRPGLDPLLIPIVAIVMPLFLVPTILVLKHWFKRREWEHLERMRSMESTSPPRMVGGVGTGGVAAIGAGVPAASVLGAFLTTLYAPPTTMFDDIPVAVVAWGCAAVIAGGGMFTALVLAFLQARTVRHIASIEASHVETFKPAFDPDTFDVVGSRG